MKIGSSCCYYRFCIVALVASLAYVTAIAQDNKPDRNTAVTVTVGNIKSRDAIKKVFQVQQGLIAHKAINASHWEPVAFRNLQSHDMILIFNIKVQPPDEDAVFLKPLEFRLL